jgi:chromosome segregation ATPase
VSNDSSSQTQPVPTTLRDEEVKIPLKMESPVADPLEVLPPKRATPKQPPAIPEETAPPVVVPDKGALFLDIAGKIVSAQPRCASYFGRQPEELSRLFFKDLLKRDFADQLTGVLVNGKQAGVQSFRAVALRKDGSEFSTQLAFKFVSGNYGYSWTVFVQAPPGHSDAINPKSSNGHDDSESRPSREPKVTMATTETTTQGETPEPESAEKPATGAEAHPQIEPAKRARKSSAEPKAQSPTEESAITIEQELESLRIRAEENETTREVLVQDLERVRSSNKLLRKKEDELNAQLRKLQAAVQQAELRASEIAAQSKDWEGKAADYKKDIDQLTAGQSVDTRFARQQTKELERQLKDADARMAAAKTEAEKLETENRQLKETNRKTRAELKEERNANKMAQQIAEELNGRVKKLQGATGNNADPQSAQVVQEFEKQLNESKASLAAARTEVEKQNSTHQRLEADNRDLAESNAKAAADLVIERDAKKLAQAEKENLSVQVEKLKSAAGQSAQRVKELEDQLKRAGDDLAASKAELQKQNAARQRPAAAESDAVLEKLVGELEQSVREGVASLAKANAEAENHRAERQRAEKSAASAAAQLEKLEEKFKRQVDLERASQAKIAELEKTIQDRGDDLARASAALRKEAKQRQVAQSRSRLVSEMGTRLESNLASLDEAKKTFEISLNTLEGSLAEANSSLEKESAERRRLEGLLADAKQQLLKLSAESKFEIVKLQKLSAESRVEISRLQAALDLQELQRERLEGDLSRPRGGAEEAEQGPNARPDDGVGSRKSKSK